MQNNTYSTSRYTHCPDYPGHPKMYVFHCCDIVSACFVMSSASTLILIHTLFWTRSLRHDLYLWLNAVFSTTFNVPLKVLVKNKKNKKTMQFRQSNLIYVETHFWCISGGDLSLCQAHRTSHRKYVHSSTFITVLRKKEKTAVCNYNKRNLHFKA